jgi:hypothetical protein
MNWCDNSAARDTGDAGDDDFHTHSVWKEFRDPDNEAGNGPFDGGKEGVP